ncbi:hypothetical protein GW17_00013843, partial [Ensete ventricosum]
GDRLLRQLQDIGDDGLDHPGQGLDLMGEFEKGFGGDGQWSSAESGRRKPRVVKQPPIATQVRGPTFGASQDVGFYTCGQGDGRMWFLNGGRILSRLSRTPSEAWGVRDGIAPDVVAGRRRFRRSRVRDPGSRCRLPRSRSAGSAVS